MKSIKYNGKAVQYSDGFTRIYTINIIDFDFKTKTFTYVDHNEMYESSREAKEQIKKDAYKLHEDDDICPGCFIRKCSEGLYETMYRNNESWKRRTYIITAVSWDNRELEKEYI